MKNVFLIPWKLILIISSMNNAFMLTSITDLYRWVSAHLWGKGTSFTNQTTIKPNIVQVFLFMDIYHILKITFFNKNYSKCIGLLVPTPWSPVLRLGTLDSDGKIRDGFNFTWDERIPVNVVGVHSATIWLLSKSNQSIQK